MRKIERFGHRCKAFGKLIKAKNTAYLSNALHLPHRFWRSRDFCVSPVYFSFNQEGLQPMKVLFVVVTGTHNAGKSTLISSIKDYADPEIETFAELGGEIRSRSKCLSWQSCEVFDELVMFREFERDLRVLSSANIKPKNIFEQWHIGNIAHAMIRSTNVAKEYIERFHLEISKFRSLHDLDIIGAHLKISKEELLEREMRNNANFMNDNQQVEQFVFFYERLEKELLSVYKILNIPFYNLQTPQKWKDIKDLFA